MTATIVLPVGISLLDWAAQFQIDFPDSSVPQLSDPAQWQGWGSAVMASSTFSAPGCPSPYQFADWRQWAEAFVGSLNA